MKTLRPFLAGVLLVSAAAWGGEFVDSCDAAPDGLVRVKNVAGSVHVQGWDSSQVSVKSILGADVERLELVCTGKLIRIEVIVPKHHGQQIESDLTVSIPKGNSLKLETVSAEARVEGVVGAVTVSTVSGGLAVQDAAGPVEAESISGDVSVSADAPSVTAKSTSGKVTVSGGIGEVRGESVSGSMGISGTMKRVEANTISGDIKMAGAANQVKLETVSGKVSVDKVLEQAEASTVSGSIDMAGDRLSAAEFSTASGDVDFMGDLAEKGILNVSTQSGDIRIRIPEQTAARYDASTLSGAIKNEFGPTSQRANEHGPGLKLQFGPPEATASVRLESASGGISIERK